MPALVGAGLLPLQARVPNRLLAWTTVPPPPVLLIVAPWETMLAPKVTPALPVSTTWPANWLPAQPEAGSPTRMATGALVTVRAVVGAGVGPATFEPHRLKKPGAVAVMPPLTWELTTVSAPPGLTVTGPNTRAELMSTLSPALTVTGPSRSPVIVRVNGGAWNTVMTTDSFAALQGEVAVLLLASPL